VPFAAAPQPRVAVQYAGWSHAVQYRVPSDRTPYNNWTVCITGQASGTQCGSIVDPCYDKFAVDDRGTALIKCNVVATYVSRPGDSGAPVYMKYDAELRADAIGIHWGGQVSDGQRFTYASPFSQVRVAIGVGSGMCVGGGSKFSCEP
jgi:hypothetical protein